MVMVKIGRVTATCATPPPPSYWLKITPPKSPIESHQIFLAALYFYPSPPSPLTMTFSSAVAGPSRIPMYTASSVSKRTVVHLARRYASDDSATDSSSTDGAGASSFWGNDKTGRAGKTYRTMLWPKWKQTVGSEFERIRSGEKAKWLGGEVVSRKRQPN